MLTMTFSQLDSDAQCYFSCTFHHDGDTLNEHLLNRGAKGATIISKMPAFGLVSGALHKLPYLVVSVVCCEIGKTTTSLEAERVLGT